MVAMTGSNASNSQRYSQVFFAVCASGPACSFAAIGLVGGRACDFVPVLVLFVGSWLRSRKKVAFCLPSWAYLKDRAFGFFESLNLPSLFGRLSTNKPGYSLRTSSRAAPC